MTATPSTAALELHAGALRLALRPDLGGAIAGFWHDTTPILRSCEPGELTSSRPSGCFPMAPYSNRIGYRHFRWHGRDYTTAPNFEEGNPHSLHGTVWKAAWRVVGASATQAELAVTHLANEHWPFNFDADPAFRVDRRRTDGAAGAHEHRRAHAAGGPGLAPVFPQAHAQPPAHRVQPALGLRPDDPAADAPRTADQHRRRSAPPRFRQLLRRLAGCGPAARRKAGAEADVVVAVPGGVHAADARLLLRRAGQPRQQRDPDGRPGCARSGRARRRRHARRLDDDRGRPQRDCG